MSDSQEPTRRRRTSRPPDPVAPDDPLEVPKWAHPTVTAFDMEPEERKHQRRVIHRRTTQRAAPSRDGFLLGMAIAPGATSILALLVSAVPFLSSSGDIPIGIVLVLIMQVCAVIMLGQFSAQLWIPSWVSVGFLTSVMMPMLALQMSLLREPYVSLEMDSAGPALLATLLVLILYAAFCLWVIWIGQMHPPIAAPLLMPATLAIPAMMGQASATDQHGALVILSEVTLITAIAAAIAWLFPGWLQLMIGACAFAAELLRLWIGGNRPWRHETSGTIVSAIYLVMLIVAVVSIVMVPVLAAMANAPGARLRLNRTLGRAA